MIKIWNYGYRESKSLLRKYDYSEVDFELLSSATMLRPFGFDISNEISANEEDSQELVFEEEIADTHEVAELHDFLDSNIKSKHSKFIETENGFVHKANAVNVLLNKQTIKKSNDRNFRVRKLNEKKIELNENDSESFIRVLDTFITVVTLKNKTISAVVFLLKNIKYNNSFYSTIQTDLLNECQLVGTILEFEKSNDEFLICSRKYGDKIESDGTLCIQIASTGAEINQQHGSVFEIKRIIESINLIRDIYANHNDCNLKVVNSPFQI